MNSVLVREHEVHEKPADRIQGAIYQQVSAGILAIV